MLACAHTTTDRDLHTYVYAHICTDIQADIHTHTTTDRDIHTHMNVHIFTDRQLQRDVQRG